MDCRTADHETTTLKALPVDEKRGLGVTKGTLAVIRGDLLLQDIRLHGDTDSTELAH